MGHGVFQKFDVVMASNATTTAELDLGRSFNRIYVDPTGAGAEVRLFAAAVSGGTYRAVYLPQDPLTATVQTNLWKIASAISGGVIQGPGGVRYLKLAVTSTAANGCTMTVYGGE